MRELKKFTVLLLYPDYASNCYGHETYLAHVNADGPGQAIDRARSECKNESGASFESLDDLHCLALLEGHHDDMNTHDR